MLVIVMTFTSIVTKLLVHVCTEKAMLSYTGYEMTGLAGDTSQLLLFVQLGSLVHSIQAGTTRIARRTFHSRGVAFASKEFSFPSRYTPICIAPVPLSIL